MYISGAQITPATPSATTEMEGGTVWRTAVVTDVTGGPLVRGAPSSAHGARRDAPAGPWRRGNSFVPAGQGRLSPRGARGTPCPDPRTFSGRPETPEIPRAASLNQGGGCA